MNASKLLTLGMVGLLAAAVSGCTNDPEYAKAEYLKSGNRYFEQKKYTEAIVQYRNALQRDAKFGEARYKLAQSYEALGDLQSAAGEYIRAADALPRDADVQVRAGSALLLMRRFEEARNRATSALKLAPNNA